MMSLLKKVQLVIWLRRVISNSFTDTIDNLLNGSTPPLRDIFTPKLLYKTAHDASCYGHVMKFKNNPDAATPNNGELPSGDLGIWQLNEGNTTQACTAAELNVQMDGVNSELRVDYF